MSNPFNIQEHVLSAAQAAKLDTIPDWSSYQRFGAYAWTTDTTIPTFTEIIDINGDGFITGMRLNMLADSGEKAGFKIYIDGSLFIHQEVENTRGTGLTLTVRIKGNDPSHSSVPPLRPYPSESYAITLITYPIKTDIKTSTSTSFTLAFGLGGCGGAQSPFLFSFKTSFKVELLSPQELIESVSYQTITGLLREV